MIKKELYEALGKEGSKKMFLKDLIEKNGDKLINRRQATDPNKKYENVFNYSDRHGGTFDSFKYYNNFVVEITK